MSYTVVLAEDDQDIRDTMVDVLEMAKFTVVPTLNGEQALAAIRARAVDVLVTDVRMPICDGAMLTRLAKAAMPELRIVIITGYADFDEDEARDLGADAFVRKPFDNQELVRLVESLAKAGRVRKAG